MKRLTRIPAPRSSRTAPRSASPWPATSSPPSVVTSCRFSGTIVAENGLVRAAIPTISGVAAISRLIRVLTTRDRISRSLSWMWRRSSRRCTVMPSAPASSAIPAAVTGSGSAPRRACRTVATWSMFTPSRFRMASVDLGADLVGQRVGDLFGLGSVLPLDHDPQARLRAAVPDDEPPPLPELLLELRLRLLETPEALERHALL